VAYNLIVASNSPVLQKLCQSIFTEETYHLHLASNLDEINHFLDSFTPEAIILEPSILDSIENALNFNNRLLTAGRVPLFLVAGTFEPLAREFLPLLRPEQVFYKPFYSDSLAEAIREAIEKNRVPDTLPEELPEIKPGQKNAAPATLPSDLRREIRLLVQQEIQTAEKELEEKIRQSLMPEIKSLFDQQEPGTSDLIHNQGRKS